MKRENGNERKSDAEREAGKDEEKEETQSEIDGKKG